MNENRKDHAYYKRLEKQAEYEVQIGKFKEAEELFLKACGGKIETYREIFSKKRWLEGFNCERHEARYHGVIGKAWLAREAYEEEKKKMEKIQMSIMFGFTVLREKKNLCLMR